MFPNPHQSGILLPRGRLEVVGALRGQGPEDLQEAEVHHGHHLEPARELLGAVGRL